MPNHSAGVVKQMLEQVSGTCDLTCMRHLQVPFLYGLFIHLQSRRL